MDVWVASSIFCILIIVSLLFWRRSNNPEYRLKRLERAVNAKLNGVSPTEINTKQLKAIYRFIGQSLEQNDQATAYKAIELLKVIHGKAPSNELGTRYLYAFIVSSVRSKHTELAGAALDAFRQTTRLLSGNKLPGAFEQLTVIGAIALRERNHYIAGKTINIMIGMLERLDWQKDPQAAVAGIDALKSLGALVLRRKDGDLFREIIFRLGENLKDRNSPEVEGKLIQLAGVWLHRIVKNEDNGMAEILLPFVSGLAKGRIISDNMVLEVVKELRNAAGLACLNPDSELPVVISEALMKIGAEGESVCLWRACVAAVGLIVRTALMRRGFKAAFLILLPLLDAGRNLLTAELRAGGDSQPGSFRQQALYFLYKECLIIVDFSARQSLTGSVGDVIIELYDCWIAHPERGGGKSAKKFCELLMLFWGSTTRQGKKYLTSLPLSRLPFNIPDINAAPGFLAPRRV